MRFVEELYGCTIHVYIVMSLVVESNLNPLHVNVDLNFDILHMYIKSLRFTSVLKT